MQKSPLYCHSTYKKKSTIMNSSLHYDHGMGDAASVCLSADPQLDHELWIVTKGARWQIQDIKMKFLRKVAGLNLQDRVRRSDSQRQTHGA